MYLTVKVTESEGELDLLVFAASPQPVFHSELSVYALVRCINSRRPIIWKGERTGLGGLLNVAAACPAPKLCTT